MKNILLLSALCCLMSTAHAGSKGPEILSSVSNHNIQIMPQKEVEATRAKYYTCTYYLSNIAGTRQCHYESSWQPMAGYENAQGWITRRQQVAQIGYSGWGYLYVGR